jgi:integrase
MNRSTALGQAIDDYLSCRHQLGFALRAEGAQLRSLGRYAQEHDGAAPLTIDCMVAWAQSPPGATPPYCAKRLDIARRFAQFQAAFDPATQVPPPGMLGSSSCRPAVHVYTQEEVRTLLQAAAQVGAPEPRPGQTYQTLLGLLWCSGLRISEALHLQCADIAWESGVLTIRHSKFGQSRLIPVADTTLAALRRYDQQRPADTTPAFFTLGADHPLCADRARKVFRQLCLQLNWTQPPQPRLHDFRHTFAVNSLIRWHQQGADVPQKILSLAAYLGHRRLSHTYWYLSAVPQLMSLVTARLPDPLALQKGAPSHG